MPERNIRLTIEYKGANFAGWQIQSNQRTIQGEITDAIFKTTACQVNVIGAGRTDAGVHALGQVANFRIDHSLDPARYRDALNFYLPEDIRIRDSAEVNLDFHARRDAVSKRYRYLFSTEKSALYRDLRWERPVQLDGALLRGAAKLIKGEHDFAPFCVAASRKESNLCRVYSSHWRQVGPLLVFEIRGDRFLHGMVRSLVGAMVNLATVEQDDNPHNLTLKKFANIMDSPEQERVAFTAPPQGLYLVSVQYTEDS
ncbi:MAG: tRNA pseudouridine(38-40) synthase TruA [Candidatus Zixiibacteriota bacterium]